MNLAVAAHAKNPYDEPVTRSNDKKTETAANCAVQGTGNPETAGDSRDSRRRTLKNDCANARHASASAEQLTHLLNRISKRSCVVADPVVPCDDGHELRRFAEQLRCCKMHRIERADGFDRKWPADASEHGIRHSNEVRTTFEPPECTHGRTFFIGCQPRGGAGT